MKFFIFFFKNLMFRASEKMKVNLFFLKLNIHLLATSLLLPHIFILIKNKLKVKIFKFSLTVINFKYLIIIIILSLSLFTLYLHL